MRVLVRLGRAGRLLLLGGVLAASLARNAAAQTSTGSIRGYVTDSSGGPLEGARVVAAGPAGRAKSQQTALRPRFYAVRGSHASPHDQRPSYSDLTAPQRHL